MDALTAVNLNPADLTSALGAAAQNVAPATIAPKDLEALQAGAATQEAAGSSSTGSFSHMLGSFINEVSDKQSSASDALSGLMSGKNVSLHQAMISMEEASLSFQMMVEVRNKLLDSYQELMRMQI